MRIIRHPVLCNYYLTFRCNAKCSFCDIWEIPSSYVTLENMKENLKHLKKLKVNVIDFTGGEPLLHRQLPEFLELAKSMGFMTTVTTNALLYPKFAEKLKGKIDMLHFSLDSPIKEEHNKSRGVNCFDHVLQSIEIAKSLGEKPDILFTVMNSNLHQIEQVYQDFALKNNFILILNPIFSYNVVGEELDTNYLNTLKKWGKKKNIYLNKAFVTLRENGGNQIENPVCKAGSTTIVISPENKLILPCYHLDKQQFPIENNLYELYYSEEVQKVVKMEGKFQECQGCTVNCYMQPSFAVNINQYFFQALPSTLKYTFEKWIW